MLADISHGHTGFADVMFLVAVILAVLAALVGFMPRRSVEGNVLREVGWGFVFGWLAVAALALGFLVL